jgi:hypothetical protein
VTKLERGGGVNGRRWTSRSALCLLLAWGGACGGGAFHSQPEGRGDGGAGGAGGSGSAVAGRGGASGSHSSGGSTHEGGSASPGAGAGGDVTSPGGAPSEGGEAPGGAGGGNEPEPPPPVSREGLVYWFKADAGITEQGGRITRWADQSGNAYDAEQGLATQRPVLTSSELVPYPVVTFEGDAVLDLPELDAPFDQGVTFFAVAGRNEDSPCAALLELSHGLEMDDLHFGLSRAAAFYEAGEFYFKSDAPVFELNTLRQVTVTHSGDEMAASAEIRASGAFVASEAIPLPARVMRDQNYIGRTQYGGCTKLVGGIGELILYARPLDKSEQRAVEAYLRDKWRLKD